MIRNRLLGKVQIFLRKRVMHFRHGIDGTTVQMKSRAIDIFVCRRIPLDRKRIQRMVKIVIVQNNLRLNPGLLERGTEIVLDENIQL